MSILLLTKLLIVPTFILLVSLAGRRWGPFISGLLSGLPVIAGPITFFLAVEQGEAFAVASAHSTLLGITALTSFCFIYGWLAQFWHWSLTLITGWSCYFLISYGIANITLDLSISIVPALLCIGLFTHFTPNKRREQLSTEVSAREIVLRMSCAAALVFSVTQFANALGPIYSGIFAAFPVAASVLAVFTHASYSGHHARALLRGVMFGLVSLSSFYYAISLLAPHFGFYSAFYGAIAIVLLLQGANYAVFLRIKKSTSHALNLRTSE